ncbi:MAB_1171c family putative transporter [Nocardia arthritidis]|uniref:DUF6545 domain-containing protein n=1 Tax=Nocardia arthritidis TaxID=228602 RepID=A0A6G9Y5N8_9NOCA|nr:MAB_1171c family putative transporter [Nocardia arthritidis]QIS08386.1 hypothetical protein F5544_02330 [Nocardia arthritidis]
MHSSWPTAISGSLIGCALLLLALRLRWADRTRLDRYANLGLAGVIIGSALREPTFQRWIGALIGGRHVANLLYQLSSAEMALVAGLTILAFGQVLGQAYSPPLVFGVAVACGAAGLAFGTRMVPEGVSLADATGWAAFGYRLSMLPIVLWMDVMLIRIGIAEWRSRTDARELVLAGSAIGFVVLHFAGIVSAAIAAAFQIDGRHIAAGRLLVSLERDTVIYQLALLTTLLTIPAAHRLTAHLGLDNASRQRRRLLPLWTALTAACPEVVYAGPADPGDSRYLLHRTVVEIRDCLRILSRYEISDAATSSSTPDQPLTTAIRLVRACAAKASGAPPGGRESRLSTADDVAEEIAELTAISRNWELARAIAIPAKPPEEAESPVWSAHPA